VARKLEAKLGCIVLRTCLKINKWINKCIFLVFEVLEFELRTFLGRCSATWATSPVLFLLYLFIYFFCCIFWIGSYLLACGQPGTVILLPTPPMWLGTKVQATIPACLLRWGLTTFLSWLALNCDLPYLHLWSNWDYKHVPLCLVHKINNSFFKDKSIVHTHIYTCMCICAMYICVHSYMFSLSVV
jgi:hypothetical protein